MRLEQCPLPGGGSLTVYLRDAAQAMPNALRRPVVVVVPGGGYNHVSAREADPVALQFAAAGYHTAILTYRVGEGARHYQPLRQLNAAIAREVLGVPPARALYNGNPKVGAFLKARVFAPGRTVRWTELVRAATGEPLNARAFAAEFKGR